MNEIQSREMLRGRNLCDELVCLQVCIAEASKLTKESSNAGTLNRLSDAVAGKLYGHCLIFRYTLWLMIIASIHNF